MNTVILLILSLVVCLLGASVFVTAESTLVMVLVGVLMFVAGAVLVVFVASGAF